jgi:hypothetical protein
MLKAPLAEDPRLSFPLGEQLAGTLAGFACPTDFKAGSRFRTTPPRRFSSVRRHHSLTGATHL